MLLVLNFYNNTHMDSAELVHAEVYRHEKATPSHFSCFSLKNNVIQNLHSGTENDKNIALEW